VAVDDHRVAVALGNLRVDAVTAEVVTALRAAGARPIVLKGPAVARWLYDAPGERPYADTDLLVARADLDRAQSTLRSLGFEPGRAGWLRGARAWSRGRAVVDLHTSVFGVEVAPRKAWAVLSRATETMEIGGVEVEVLAAPARALNVATHATQHPHFTGTRRDLERAVAALPRSTWEAAAREAAELRAEAAVGAGLRLVEGGAALAESLDLDARASPEATLLASDAPVTALGIAQLAAAGSTRLRAALLARALVPRRSTMRASSELARRGELGLALAYLRRAARLARSMPAGLAAWRRARR
jgi:hypothetical protein